MVHNGYHQLCYNTRPCTAAINDVRSKHLPENTTMSLECNYNNYTVDDNKIYFVENTTGLLKKKKKC